MSGSRKELPDGGKLRGDINVLLLGLTLTLTRTPTLTQTRTRTRTRTRTITRTRTPNSTPNQVSADDRTVVELKPLDEVHRG